LINGFQPPLTLKRIENFILFCPIARSLIKLSSKQFK
jgi:hypothetical protein